MHFQLDPRTAIPYAVILVFLILVLRRAASTKTVFIERLWISPVLLVVAAAALLNLGGAAAFGPTIIAMLVAVFAVGAAIGWWRGRLTHVEIDPATRELTSKMSPAGVLLVAALFLARYFVHTLAVYEPNALPAAGPGHAGLAVDGLVVFGVGVVAAKQLEMWIRCRRLLAETPAGH